MEVVCCRVYTVEKDHTYFVLCPFCLLYLSWTFFLRWYVQNIGVEKRETPRGWPLVRTGLLLLCLSFKLFVTGLFIKNRFIIYLRHRINWTFLLYRSETYGGTGEWMHPKSLSWLRPLPLVFYLLRGEGLVCINYGHNVDPRETVVSRNEQ